MNGLKLDSVFDATQASVGDSAKANVYTLAQAKPCDIRIHLERFAPADIPLEEEALGKWLFKVWEEKEKRLEAFTKDETFDTDQDKSILLEVRPDACKVMYGSIVWFVCCVVAFVLWCIGAGRIKLLAGSGFSFLSLIALICFVLQKVHFEKSTHGTKKRS